MKILNLEMQAFGPFAQGISIDFARARNEGLFLIQGPTGAGKTSILDALCYALYGSSSGSERQAIGLRSHHVAEETATIVQLDFEVSDRVYRVRRQMSGRKSANLNEKVQLEDCGEPASVGEETHIISDKRGDVAEKINALIHLTETQFRQVIVLPQGKFRELLVAKSQVREEILKSLFDTARLEDLVNRVLSRRKSQEELCQRLEQEIRFKQENLELDSLDDLPQVVQDMKREAESLDQEHQRVTESANLRRSELEQARVLAGLFRQADSIAETIRLLGTKAPLGQRIQLAKARAASTLAPVLDVFHTQALEYAQQKSLIEGTEVEIHTCESARILAAAELAQAEVARREIGHLRDRLAERKSLLPLLAGLEQEKQKTVISERESHLATTRAHDLRQRLNTMKAHLGDLSSEKHLQTRWIATVSPLEKIKYFLQDIGLCVHEVSELGKEGAELDEQSRQNSADLERLRDEAHSLNLRMDAARHAESASSAHNLALALRDGQACPVCGSLHHPEPAPSPKTDAASIESDSLQASVDKNQEFLRRLEIQGHIVSERVQKTQQTIALLLSKKRVLWTGLSELINSLPDSTPADESTPPAFSALVAELSHALKGDYVDVATLPKVLSLLSQAQASGATGAQLEKQCVALENSIAETGQQVHQEESSLAVLKEKSSARRAMVDETETKLSTALGQEKDQLSTESQLRQVLEAEAAQIERIEGKFEQCRIVLAEIDQSLTAAKTRREELQRGAAHLADKQSSTQKLLTVRTAELGFSDHEEAVAALIDHATMDELERSIQQWEREDMLANEQKKLLDLQLQGAEFPDVFALETFHTESEVLKSEIERRRTLHQDRLTKFQRGAIDISKNSLAYEQARVVLNSIAGLAKLLSGQDSDGAYVNLQRYALSVYLDEILQNANQHLSEMSRGRYELVRQDNAEGRKKTGGLELQILDSYTGIQRGTESLSGGESFLAALALALGLSSVVHQRSGGIRLDTLFIDEGFGSLDEDALQEAMNVLGRLHERGRTVGIISHVRELQERIPVQLCVSRTPTGSTVAWNSCT